MFSSSRLVMNSRQLWNWHQGTSSLGPRHLGILKFRVSEMAFQGIFTADAMLFHQNTRKTGNNASCQAMPGIS